MPSNRTSKSQQRKAQKKIEKAFEEAVYDLGQQVLDRARALVPVNSGDLRDSGTLYRDRQGRQRGWTIVFDSPYASDVEEGINREQHPENYLMNVRKHKRRLASGKVTTVRKHTKQYYNYQRPWNMGNDDWRIVTMKDVEGVRFLTDAWRNVRAKVKDRQLRRMLPTHLDRRPLGHGASFDSDASDSTSEQHF